MATNPFDDMNLLSTQSATTTPTTYQNHYNRADDSTSASYIPRMARTVPHSSTVHTIFIKKITYPMTSRPDELWILERTTDGMETWRPIETFLGNLQLTQDPRALRATANQWRLHYDVSPISPSTSTLPLYILFYHILNIPMCTSDSLSPPFRTIHITIMLGTLRAAPFPRLSYIALLATMALNSSVFTR